MWTGEAGAKLSFTIHGDRLDVLPGCAAEPCTGALKVAVDNQPPVLEIQAPASGEKLSTSDMRPDGRIIFLTNAQDNLGIQEIAFYLDGELLNRLTPPPYALSWLSTPGQHTLQVIALDQAGNTADASIEFSVAP